MPKIAKPIKLVKDKSGAEAGYDPTGLDYDPNEIVPQNDERIGFFKIFVAEKILLGLVILLSVIMLYTLLHSPTDKEKAAGIFSKPKPFLIPFALAGVFYAVLSKKKEKYKTKKAIVKIIDSIPENEIPIKKILDIYKPNHNNKEYIEKEVIALVIDVLWDGYITEYKYIIDKQKLVRIEKSNEQQATPTGSEQS